jgi:hypothetical protein
MRSVEVIGAPPWFVGTRRYVYHRREPPQFKGRAAVRGRPIARALSSSTQNCLVTAPAASLEDYRWLVSEAAQSWLAETAARAESVSQVAQLRRQLSPEQTHLVLEQVALRSRAKVKFRGAARMFFAARPLEQATDEVVAAYKAQRFQAGEPIVDFCCGIGGDLLSLASRGPVLGVDRDPILALLAGANLANACDRVGDWRSAVVIQEAAPRLLAGASLWHIDPDRRPHGRRTTRAELYEPGPELIDALLAAQPSGAVKLAPAAELPPSWQDLAEQEWISRQGVCRQLVAWFGSLTSMPGSRRATVLGHFSVRTLVGQADERVPTAPEIGRYVFEPDAAVLAARLQAVLAAEQGLTAIAPQVAYWTGDRPIADALLAGFAVQDVLPYDVRRVKAYLRERGVGRLEVKQRGTGLEPATVQRQLRVSGDATATLLLARRKGKVTAIVAERLHTT